MIKSLLLLFFIILLVGCQEEKLNSHNAYQSISCEYKEGFKKNISSIKKMVIYISMIQ